MRCVVIEFFRRFVTRINMPKSLDLASYQIRCISAY